MLQVYEEMQKSLKQMRHLAGSFEKELKTLPQGSLSMKTRNAKAYYYCNIWCGEKRQKFYLKPSSKRDQTLLKKLQRRRFVQKALSILNADIAALEQALKKFEPYDPARVISELSPVYQEVQPDSAIWLPAEPDLKQWAAQPYNRYQGHPDSLIHETSTGLMVRSKAESMIADTLTLFGIPFHYEQLLEANGNIYAPDFTILPPATRKLMYWEHFGKMDDAEYVLDNAKKVMDYRQAGIKSDDNFLMTFEDGAHPLTMREIQDVIKMQLL